MSKNVIMNHHTMELVPVQSVLDQMLYNILICSLERVYSLLVKFIDDSNI